MKNKSFLARYIVCFCAVTTGICIMEGVLGGAFFPDKLLHFDAYLVPPVFGLLTSLTGLVVESRRDLSVGQMLFRMFLQLVLIECIVFGSNILVGNRYSPQMAVVVALQIAAIFVFVYFVMWFNERRIANEFNKRLVKMQMINLKSENLQ